MTVHLLGAWGDASAGEVLEALRVDFARVQTSPDQAAHLQALLNRLAQLDTPERIAGEAFDQAAIWQWPELADAIAQTRDRLLPSSPGWTSSPELDTWDRFARWWSRRVALVCLLGMRQEPQYAAGLGAAARDVVQAPAWRSSEPAGRALVLTLYTWALEQSPIPAGATWTRAMLARQAHVAGYRKPSTAELVWDGAKEAIPDSPGELAAVGVGLGLLVGIGILASLGPAATIATLRGSHAGSHR